ncbi:hypothetical protein BK797_05895 [Kosakonia sacchari]|nr:hypothetical protein BK797_05895 [Kosakonia sacchari]
MGGLAERLFYNHAHSMLHHLWRNLLSVVWRSDGKQIFKRGKNQVTYKNAIKHVTGALPWYGQHGDLFRPATDTRAKRLTRCQRYRTVNQKPKTATPFLIILQVQNGGMPSLFAWRCAIVTGTP